MGYEEEIMVFLGGVFLGLIGGYLWGVDYKVGLRALSRNKEFYLVVKKYFEDFPDKKIEFSSAYDFLVESMTIFHEPKAVKEPEPVKPKKKNKHHKDTMSITVEDDENKKVEEAKAKLKKQLADLKAQKEKEMEEARIKEIESEIVKKQAKEVAKDDKPKEG